MEGEADRVVERNADRRVGGLSADSLEHVLNERIADRGPGAALLMLDELIV